MWKVSFVAADAKPVAPANESRALVQLTGHLRRRLGRYRTTVAEDDAIIADPSTGPRQTVAARLVRIEKGILQGTLAAVLKQPGAEEAVAAGGAATDAGGVQFG